MEEQRPRQDGQRFGKYTLIDRIAVGGMAEIIAEGQTGFLLPPGRKPDWRQRILQLAQDPELSQRLGEMGRKWLEREVYRRRGHL